MNNLNALTIKSHSRFRSLAVLAVTVSSLGWGLPAAAATVIYDNGGADGSRGWWSDFDGTLQPFSTNGG